MESARALWDKALGELQIQISKANYTTWLKNSQGVSYQNNIFLVGVSNAFTAEWLSQRLYSLVRKTLTDIIGQDVDVQFIVHNQDRLQTKPLVQANQTDGGTSTKIKLERFNARYTFDNFIVGDHNRLAYAAALEVAEHPGLSYNPLFIHSSTGQGKTHLLHSIGHIATNNGFQVAYISAERFTNEFVLAAGEKKIEAFRTKFRNIHILLFDDIQFIIGKKQTLQCFFHIFNELYNNNLQIIITADTPPQDMALSSKLRSRLEWGLVVPIQSPDLKTRLSILRAKSESMMMPMSEDALHNIASKLQENARQLEGALTYLNAQAKLSGIDVSSQIIDDLLTSTPNKNDPRLIIQIVAEYFSLLPEDLIEKRRDRKVTAARQIAMYLIREENNCSFAEIGKALGHRNHATILHGYEKIASEMNVNHTLYSQILEIKEEINTAKASKKLH